MKKIEGIPWLQEVPHYKMVALHPGFRSKKNLPPKMGRQRKGYASKLVKHIKKKLSSAGYISIVNMSKLTISLLKWHASAASTFGSRSQSSIRPPCSMPPHLPARYHGYSAGSDWSPWMSMGRVQHSYDLWFFLSSETWKCHHWFNGGLMVV